MKNRIEKAFNDFDSGVRPEGYKAPRHWYVLNANGKAYPAKGIWALVTDERPRNFNSRDARKEFANLGYLLIDSRVFTESGKFENEVDKSKSDTSENRKRRLKLASKKPTIIFIITKSYKRNPDVVAEVQLRANGVCEKCLKPAPFKKRKDLSPYLEVHHIVQLANDGDDSVENAIALCPNCHRENHFG